MLHIFNISALHNRIEANKGEKNLYEKINQLMKGARIDAPELKNEIVKIIKEETKEMLLQLEGEA